MLSLWVSAPANVDKSNDKPIGAPTSNYGLVGGVSPPPRDEYNPVAPG